ncbi:MAG TPA: hypothetical protein V6D19_09890 [Stenomitos sp.]
MRFPLQKQPHAQNYLQTYFKCIWFLRRGIDATIPAMLLWGLCLVSRIKFSGPYITLAVLSIALMLPLLEGMNLYKWINHKYFQSDVTRLWMGWIGVCLLLLLVGVSTQTLGLFVPHMLAVWFGLTLIVLYLHCLHLQVLLQRRRKVQGLMLRKAVIAGTGELSQRLAHQLLCSPQLGLQFHGFFSESSMQSMNKLSIQPLLGLLEDLPDYTRRHHIDVVYIVLSLAQGAAIRDLIARLQDTTACVYFVPDLTALGLLEAQIHNLQGIPLIAVSAFPKPPI